MAFYSIEDKKLINIANAIREKAGTENKYQVDDMVVGVDEVFEAGQDVAKKIVNRTIVEYSDKSTTEIGAYSFAKCGMLETADFHSVEHIEANAFNRCTALTSLILRNSSNVCTLADMNAISTTPLASNTIEKIIPTPNGLPGIPVSSNADAITANYTDSACVRWVTDEIDFARGVYVQRVGSFTLNGSISWNQHGGAGGTNGYRYYTYASIGQAQCYDSSNGMFSMFSLGNLSSNHRAFVGKDTIQLRVDEITTTTELQAFFEANPCEILFALETPVETELDADTLSLYSALRILGATAITNSASIHMDVGYTSTSGTEVTVSGTNVTINDGVDGPLNALTLYGKTTHAGTPSPQAPVDLIDVGSSGSISVIVAHLNAESDSGAGYIYVPSALLDGFKQATNWSVFSSQFRAIEDYPDITGG